VNANILGVALENGDWDLDSLGDNIGYISESAAPASAGNSVLTGHVYNWGNIPGPFVNLKNLKVGETVTLTSAGKVFTYVVRSTQVVDDTDFATVFSKETSSWLTLMTCETYNYATAFYSQRRVVKAELLSVK
jgi:LPXTG-site transpeptidase (sortase) family protein